MAKKKTLTKLMKEVEVKIENPNIPIEYPARLREILRDFNEESETIIKRVVSAENFRKRLLSCIALEESEALTLNMLSAYETTYFYDALIATGNGENVCKMMAVYNTIRCLSASCETGPIYQMLRSTYYAAGMYLPKFYNEILSNKDLYKDFMYELLADLQELIAEDFETVDMDEDIYCDTEE